MESLKKLNQLLAEKKELESVPKEFNALFAESGWIAYESMSFNLIKSAVQKGKERLFDEANSLLIEYYRDKSTLDFLLSRGNTLPAYMIRKQLVMFARRDFEEQRYYSSIMLVLSIIDGITNDIVGHDFFDRETDVQAWNSLAGDERGLSILQGVFGIGRRKTRADEIDKPYRNGIMHGRDLGFNNVVTAAKCWGLLAALICWAKVVTSPEYKPTPPKTQTLTEIIGDLTDNLIIMKEKTVLRERISKWRPRTAKIEEISASNITSATLPIYSPERAVVEFLEFWKRENYGHMCSYINFKSETTNDQITTVKRFFAGIGIDGWRIQTVKDEAPCISEVAVGLDLRSKKERKKACIRFRMFYAGDNVINGDMGGKWEIIRYAVGNNRFETLENML